MPRRHPLLKALLAGVLVLGCGGPSLGPNQDPLAEAASPSTTVSVADVEFHDRVPVSRAVAASTENRRVHS
jgi:hypothetical protein